MYALCRSVPLPITTHTLSHLFPGAHAFDAFPAPICFTYPVSYSRPFFSQLPSEFAKLSDGESLASFWRGYGRKKFPVVASVARAVLAAPASSAVLERDFSEYGELANRQQCASLPPEYAEILTFLRRTRDSIPMDVPSLSPGAVDAAIPVRLKDPNKMAEVADIGSGIVEDLPVRGVEGAIADIFAF